MTYKHKFTIKNDLERYCNIHGIITNKHMKCLDSSKHKHNDKTPSMRFNNDMLYCHACGVKYDIYDLIKLHYNLNSFKEQYIKSCSILGYDCEFGKSKNIKEIADVINIKDQKDIKLEKFNIFCDKLIGKRSELQNIINLIEDKNLSIYQDLKFKIDYITRFLDNNLEYNSQTLDNISNFNKDFDMVYRNFKEYFLDIM